MLFFFLRVLFRLQRCTDEQSRDQENCFTFVNSGRILDLLRRNFSLPRRGNFFFIPPPPSIAAVAEGAKRHSSV